jgi:ribosomal protein L7/L12
MTTYESLKAIAEQMRHAGATTDDWLQAIRNAGATQIVSVKLVRELEGVPLDEAKVIVDDSPVWDDKREVNRVMREELAEQVMAEESRLRESRE